MPISHYFCMRQGKLLLFLFACGRALIWGSTLLLCDLEVNLEWFASIMMILIFLPVFGLEEDWTQILAKETWGLSLLGISGKEDSYSSKGTCWGNGVPFFCCFLLCLEVAVFWCDAWNCISLPVTWGIAAQRTYLTHWGLQSRKRARGWGFDDTVGPLN